MIDWHDIDTVLLDMDGTLLDLHFDNYFWMEYLPMVWGSKNGHDRDTAKSILMPRIMQRQGTLSWYCLDFWSRNLALDIKALNRELRHLIAARPDTEQFLQQLRKLAKPCVLVTNSHQDLLALKLERTGIGPYFDAVFSAHGFGAAKEEAAFWQQLQNAFPYDPARTLLIDDNTSVLDTARRSGIRYLLTISQPDSQSPPRCDLPYPAVDSFATLFQQRP